MAKRKTTDPSPAPAKLSDLAAAPYNPRTISAPELSALGFSMAEFGDISGLVWNAKTQRLVAGHQRVKSLRQQYGDLAIVDGAVQTPEGHRFPLRIVDWPESKELAANIAANSPTLTGSFTEDLVGLLEEIHEQEAALFDGLNFGAMPDIADLLADHPQDEAPGPVTEDEAPPVDEQGEPDSRPGAVYCLGGDVLVCSCCGALIPVDDEDPDA